MAPGRAVSVRVEKKVAGLVPEGTVRRGGVNIGDFKSLCQTFFSPVRRALPSGPPTPKSPRRQEAPGDFSRLAGGPRPASRALNLDHSTSGSIGFLLARKHAPKAPFPLLFDSSRAALFAPSHAHRQPGRSRGTGDGYDRMRTEPQAGRDALSNTSAQTTKRSLQ